jgi:hypothetical protein
MKAQALGRFCMVKKCFIVAVVGTGHRPCRFGSEIPVAALAIGWASDGACSDVRVRRRC